MLLYRCSLVTVAMMRARLILFVLAVILIPRVLRADSWEAQPIIVHEWGVQAFDWTSSNQPQAPPLPDFIYTDSRPGRPLPVTTKRAKDLPPDSGIRFKPVLYFYCGDSERIKEPIPIGVEMRFAYGHAMAWWPEVNVYRTPEQTAAAKPVDWTKWRHATGRDTLYRSPSAKTLSVPVPDDERFELAWHSLSLSKQLPTGQTLAGPALADDHWLKVARLPQSDFVSNGTESEKFLFYEGKTRETPAVLVVPDPRSYQTNAAQSQAVVNAGPEPIYDVFAIYRSAKGVWVGYVAVLDTLRQADPLSREIPQQPALLIPDFSKAGWEMKPEDFTVHTTPRLVDALTAGGSTTGSTFPMRDPSDPQLATATHTLYADEAIALERIWHGDFFAAEGLTIIYRQSPAALDDAMPLNIHTDMYHYIKLSRCGLVVNKNIDLSAYGNADLEIETYLKAKDDHGRIDAIAELRKYRFTSIGLLRLRLCGCSRYGLTIPTEEPRLRQLISELSQ